MFDSLFYLLLIFRFIWKEKLRFVSNLLGLCQKYPFWVSWVSDYSQKWILCKYFKNSFKSNECLHPDLSDFFSENWFLNGFSSVQDITLFFKIIFQVKIRDPKNCRNLWTLFWDHWTTGAFFFGVMLVYFGQCSFVKSQYCLSPDRQ